MKSLMLLWRSLADELAGWCCTSAIRDFETVTVRAEHEGLSFLTITLAEFGSDFQFCLDQGSVGPSHFAGFSRRGDLPRFLGGFLDLVFHRNGGLLVDEPNVDAIYAIRQLTLLFAKVAIPCSDARVRKAMVGYVDTENDVRQWDAKVTQVDLDRFTKVSRMLFANMLTVADRKVYEGDLLPKHGPGSTADRISGNRKFDNMQWTSRMESIMPSGEMLLPNWSYLDRFDSVDIVEPDAETPVRVITVPKTLKTPRIIAMEPTCMMYAQQALLATILDAYERDNLLSSLVGFRDQTPNQRLALKGSLTGNLATLDLSEASDRVSNRLVQALLGDHPHLYAAVQASRSSRADVLGEVLDLSKFASMGSALCFPMEAFVFLTLVILGIEHELSRSLTPRELYALKGKVRIYGDDIIVPVRYVRSVMATLTRYGFKVNARKSFWTGRFRESCGKDYYNGVDVSVCRFRQRYPSSRRDATEIVSLISFRNQLYFRGLWRTCAMLDRQITGLIQHYPVVLPSSPVQGRHSFLGFETQKTCPELHRPLVRGYVTHSVIPVNSLEGPGALLKCLLKMEERDRGRDLSYPEMDPDMPMSGDKQHLERSGRPQSVSIKLRWDVAY